MFLQDGWTVSPCSDKDECTRWTFREMYAEHSTYSAYGFLKKLIKCAPFPIREIQTDNGSEFTNALLVLKATHKTMFVARTFPNVNNSLGLLTEYANCYIIILGYFRQ